MMKRDDEEWRPVVGFENHYQISRSGLVRRIKEGQGNRGTHVGRILTRHLSDIKGKDYFYHTLSVDGKVKVLRLHRMIYEAFVGPIPNGMQINHKNGIKTDNSLENLELATPSENRSHAVHVLGKRPGMIPTKLGENHHRSILSDVQALEVYTLWKQRVPHKDICSKYGIKASTLQYTVYRRCKREELK